MFKFALFIIVAFLPIQGFQTSAVESQHQVRDRDLIDFIKELVQKIEDLVNRVENIVGDLISSLTNKIKEIINKIPEIVNQIGKKFEDLAIEAGETGKKCVDAHETDIEDTVNTARNGMKACANEAQSKVNDTTEQVNVLVGKVAQLQQDIAVSVGECVAEAILNPNILAQCLRDLIASIQEEIADIKKEVGNIITIANDTIAAATIDLANCVAKVEQDVATKQEALFNALKECIAGSINY